MVTDSNSNTDPATDSPALESGTGTLAIQQPDTRLALEFISRHPTDAARYFELLSPRQIAEFLGDVSIAATVSLIEKLHPHLLAEVLAHLSEERTSALLNRVNPSLLARCFAHIPAEKRELYFQKLKKGARESEIRELLSYDPDSAGGIMDTQVLTFSPSVTVKQVTTRLKKIRKRQLHMLVVTGEDQKLMGLIPLQDVILAKPTQPLSELIRSEPPRIASTATRDEIDEFFSGSRLIALPVVDFEGRFLGLIRQHNLVRAIKDEALTDMQTMVGVSRDERALSPPLTSVAKRLPWLNINLLTAFLAAAVVGFFESTIASVTALAVLLPVVAGQSGNTGAQALAVTMRGLALKEVNTSQWLRLAFKEAMVGAINGTAIAVVCAVAVIVWSQSLGLAAIIGISMIMSMTIASVSGTIIPVILRRMGLDPAQSSSIILTTVTDIMGFMSFLGLATLLMGFI